MNSRLEDIRALVEERNRYLKGKTFDQACWDVIFDYPWPGNTRELFNMMKRVGVLLDNPVNASDLEELLYKDRKQAARQKNGKIAEIFDRFEAGEDFWQVVKTPYLARDLNREEVKKVLAIGLSGVGGKRTDLVTVFNIEKADYPKFVKFLHRNKLV